MMRRAILVTLAAAVLLAVALVRFTETYKGLGESYRKQWANFVALLFRNRSRSSVKGATAGGGWNTATATWYTSYPECCRPGFKGDRAECRKSGGCKYQGMFAALDGKKSEDWVKANDIVAVFQSPNSRNRKEWAAKWKNKRLRIRNPKTGKVMEVTALDTCDDNDCGGCCTENANKNGGTLIDLERNTALRFYDGKVEDLAKIEWQMV